MRGLLKFFAVMGAVLCLAAHLAKAEEPATLRVATRIVPPLVMDDHGRLTGFSIDLWDAVAKRLGVTSTYEVSPDVNALLSAISSGKQDLAIAAISITSERDRTLDFSQPILNSGLQILVRGSAASETNNPFRGLFRLLFSPVILVWLGIALVLILLPAHLVWWLERRQSQGIIPTKAYFPGIFHAMWWAAGTLATQADQMPRNWLARIVAVLWMFTSVVFVAYYTAQLTASLTVEQIQSDIKSPEDLPGKRVAATRGSTAVSYLLQNNATVQQFETINECYKALQSGAVNAVVFDAPVLMYLASHEGKGVTQLAGTIFRREDYGIAYPENSPLRKKVDSILLAMREDGSYQQIYDKWFSTK